MLGRPQSENRTENQTYQSSRMVEVERRPWSPAQLVALGLGVVFVVIGGIALARTGIHVDSLWSVHVTVAGAGQTQLMGYIEVVFGALLLTAGAVPGAGRGGMVFLGLVAFVFGIIERAQPSSFALHLGTGGGYAIFLIVVGAVLLLSAIVAPIYWTTNRRYGTTRHDRLS
jgi:hypothetical protein